MKKYAILLFVALCLAVGLQLGVYAYDGYLVQMNAGAVSLFSADSSLEPVVESERIYKVESEADAQELVASGLASVYVPNYTFTLFDTPNDPIWKDSWGYQKVNACAPRISGNTGAGVRLAVIDSGILSSHEDFNSANIDTGYNVFNDSFNVQDTLGHGTQVSGIIAAQVNNGIGIAGITPDVTLVPIKVFEGKTTSLDLLLKGLEKAIELQCDVINMSLGTSEETDAEKMTAIFQPMIEKATAKNIFLIAAVGNEHDKEKETDFLSYPAALDQVVGVGAVDQNNVVGDFSQRNSSVFVCAPGVNISTTTNLQSRYVYAGGTSFSCPFIAALAAAAKQADPDLTFAQFQEYLIASAQDLGSPGYDIVYGYGVVDFGEFMRRVTGTSYVWSPASYANGTLTARLSYYGSTAAFPSLYGAAYDHNGRMTQISSYASPLSAYSITPVELTFSSLPEDSSYFRFFCLDPSTLAPLCEKGR